MKKCMKNTVKITVEKKDRDALRALRQDTGKRMIFLCACGRLCIPWRGGVACSWCYFLSTHGGSWRAYRWQMDQESNKSR